MNERKQFFRRELEQKEFTHKEAKRAVRCWRTVYTDTGGYVEQDFTFHLFENGAITLSENDGDGFLSIGDKETLDVIRELLQ